ncbi:amphi-Trp domain-containing protein [Desulfoplanes sp.]
MEKKKVALEQTKEFKAAISYLEDLVASFKKGTIVVEQGENSVILTPAPFVNIEIEAKQKGDKEKFSMELSWNTAGTTEESDIMISSTLPQTKAPSEVEVKEPAKAPAEKSNDTAMQETTQAPTVKPAAAKAEKASETPAKKEAPNPVGAASKTPAAKKTSKPGPASESAPKTAFAKTTSNSAPKPAGNKSDTK